MNTLAGQKPPTLYRELVFSEITIEDFQEFERTGKYDHNVLLWLQNGYVERVTCMREASGLPLEKDDLVGAVSEFYLQEKEEGRGLDLKGYLDAAKTFFDTEAFRYGGHLQDLAEYIEKASENGVRPNVELNARHAYVSMAKLSSAMSQMENVSGRSAATEVGRMIKLFVESQSSNPIGQQLLQAVEKISHEPRSYIEFHEPSQVEIPTGDPWNYDPMRLDDDYSMTVS